MKESRPSADLESGDVPDSLGTVTIRPASSGPLITTLPDVAALIIPQRMGRFSLASGCKFNLLNSFMKICELKSRIVSPRHFVA